MLCCNNLETDNTTQPNNQSNPMNNSIDQTPETTHADPQMAQRPTPRTSKRVLGAFAAAALTGAALAALGIAPRQARERELAATTQAVAEARRAVTVVRPTRDGTAYELRLPGSTAALQSAVLHARTSGYLKSFRADIGDRVKAGEVLAEIESPEVDEQLKEARAMLKQRRADHALATYQLERLKGMHAERAASRSELEERIAQHNASTAAIGVSEAVVARLEKEQSFQKVIAPFDGVVTQRHVELGSLVTAGSSAGITPLFRIEQDGVLKVFIDVPQSAAPSVSVGQAVQVEIREFGGRRFPGRVVRTAGSVDPATRTLRTEVHLPNPGGEVLAGVYVQVHLGVQDPRRPLRIPAASLVAGAQGPQVVSVGAGDILRRVSVTLGRDLGKEIEVTAGLRGDERLVTNPRDDHRDGESVDVR